MSARPWTLDAARVLALVLVFGLHAAGLVAVVGAWESPEILRRDYIAIFDAGRRALEGEALYEASRFPFLHPPPVAALAVPLAALSPRAAYVAITAASLAALALALLALRRLAPRPGEHDLVVLGVLASAPWVIGLVLGQPLSLALAAWLLGLLAWQRGHALTAGVLFGALLLKPPLALALLATAIVRGERRVLAGFGGAALVLFALSLPLGLGPWADWVEALSRALGSVHDARMLLWKQHTLLAFLRSVAPAWVAWTCWSLVAVPAGVLVLAQVRRRGLSPLRAGGLLGLATVALAPYAYFYDALLLVIPAAALWLEREAYSSRSRWLLSAVAVLTFAWQHVGFFVLQRGPALAGLLVTLWLALELWSARPSLTEPRPSTPDIAPDFATHSAPGEPANKAS